MADEWRILDFKARWGLIPKEITDKPNNMRSNDYSRTEPRQKRKAREAIRSQQMDILSRDIKWSVKSGVSGLSRSVKNYNSDYKVDLKQM